MGDHELENLIVRLTGDGSSFQGMLASAQSASSQAAEVVGAATKQIEQMSQSLQGFAQNAVSALGSLGVTRFLRDTFQQFEGQETNAIRLTAALRANGREVTSTLAEYHEFARSIAAVSTASEEQILSSLRAAETHELTGAAAERAAQAALNLSYATHGSADGMEHMMRVTAAMEKGDVKTAQRYGRMIEQLRGVRDEGEFVRKYQLLLATGMQTAAEVANSSAGQLAKLGHAYNEFKMQLGSIVADVVKPYVRSLIELVDWLKNLDRGTKTVIVAVLGLVAAALALGPALAAFKFWAALSLNPLVLGIVAAGAAIGMWVNEMGGVAAAWTEVKRVVGEFLEQNQRLLSTVGAVVGVVGAAVLVWKSFWLVVGLTNSVLAFFHVYQVAGIFVWALWKGAVLAAQAVLMLFNANLAIANFMFSGNAVFVGMWTSVVAVAKIATWLLTGAISVLYAVLAPAAVVAAAATFWILAGAFIAVAAAATSLWGGLTTVYELLSSLPITYGPLRVIGDMFGEWFAILKDVVRAAKVDLPLAWEILKAGAMLAVAQVKALWPPLWSFIQNGFTLIWRVTWEIMKVEFFNAIAQMSGRLLVFMDVFGWFTGGITEDMRRLSQTVARAEAAGIAEAERRLAVLSAKFRFEDNDEIRAARAEVDRLRGLIPEAERRSRDAATSTGSAIDTAKKSLENFKGVLSGSAEALSRLTAYQERLNAPPAPGSAFAGAGSPATSAGGASGASPTFAGPQRPETAGADSTNPLAVLLAAIRDVLRERLPTNPLTTDSLAAIGGFPS